MSLTVYIQTVTYICICVMAYRQHNTQRGERIPNGKNRPNYTRMRQSCPGMHKVAVAMLPLAIFRYSFAVASYRPSAAPVFGGSR
jgi:hypothetical protein